MSSYDPGRWRSGLFSLKNTLTLPILKRAAFVTVWSIIVQEFVFAGVIPAVSSLAHSTIGVAFGLLLVFRTNTSYDRFWEGRRLWGTIIEESRNLARIIAAEMPAMPRPGGRVVGLVVLLAIPLVVLLGRPGAAKPSP